jgi:hypothetical protein
VIALPQKIPVTTQSFAPVPIVNFSTRTIDSFLIETLKDEKKDKRYFKANVGPIPTSNGLLNSNQVEHLSILELNQ